MGSNVASRRNGPCLKVDIGRVLSRFVSELVDGGLYRSESEVIREGLRMLKDREDLKGSTLDAVRRGVALGANGATAGRLKPFDEQVVARTKANGWKRLAKRQAAAGRG